MVAPVEALVAIPESLNAAEAAPLLCAGITSFNALRHSGAMPGDLVAVQGIGGLGHLSSSDVILFKVGPQKRRLIPRTHCASPN